MERCYEFLSRQFQLISPAAILRLIVEIVKPSTKDLYLSCESCNRITYIYNPVGPAAFLAGLSCIRQRMNANGSNN